MEIRKGTKVLFKFDDGSTLDWAMTEPCAVDHLIDGIERWARLNKPSERRHDGECDQDGCFGFVRHHLASGVAETPCRCWCHRSNEQEKS